MVGRDRGFTIVELMISVVILVIIAAFAIPSALSALQSYRLHADTASVSGFFNISRMKATSQYAPYRVDVDTGAGTFQIEQLCGVTSAATDAACTGSAYIPHTTAAVDTAVGTQYLQLGNTFLSCRPAGIPAASVASPSPGSITADPAGCPATPPNPLYFYFNTRGLPVDTSGNMLTNGGAVLYLQNQSQLLDAITISIGGRVTTWNWSSGSNTWSAR